ncbi:MAG: aldo/keto reductase [Opitutaceae bacterium]|nr:aldo/keto reductase [Opitutaceae bacterium]
MKYRSLGRTGVKVSPLCLGTMMFGGRTEPEDSYAIIDQSIERGLNFIDTANMYSRGRSEEVVGEALKRNGKREQIVLATKVFNKMGDDPNMQGSSRRHIIQQCEASLKRLQTDHIDLYQIHRPTSEVPIDETLRAFDDLIRSGKVRYIGTSTFSAWQVIESLWVSKELGLNRFVCEQPPYSILDRRIESELLPMAQTYGTAIIPWSPLASGLLTGKYKRNSPPPQNSRFANHEKIPFQHEQYNDQVFDVLDGLEKIADAKGCTLSQFSLAWCMHQSGITSPIIGPRTMEQLEDNLKALEVEITEEDCNIVDELVKPGTFVAPFYMADFGPHQFHW